MTHYTATDLIREAEANAVGEAPPIDKSTQSAIVYALELLMVDIDYQQNQGTNYATACRILASIARAEPIG